MQSNKHHIYLAESLSWRDIEKNKSLTKIGSSNNPYARMKSFKTSNPYPVKLIGYFIIYDFNCYKLDNIIKIQFNDKRSKLEGGIEFYYDVHIDQLKKLFDSFCIKFEWINDTNESMNNLSIDDMVKEDAFVLSILNEEKKELFEFDKVNILLSPVPKSSNLMYKNYSDTY